MNFTEKTSIIEFLQPYRFSIAESTNIYIIPSHHTPPYNLTHELRFIFIRTLIVTRFHY
jgi:hypothetical protein